ncbi:hypothetical protein C8R46DRAFT_1044807 [Mycena filopes]|nr:hypothetical protein C8R46DRAFT_1044807 [Mycena filopes]
MTTLDPDRWERRLARDKIKSLKRELAISKDYERVIDLGIARLKVKHLMIKADLRVALEQNEALTAYKEGQSGEIERRHMQKVKVEAAVMCGVCHLTLRNPDTASVRASPNKNGALESTIDVLVQTGLIEYDLEKPASRMRGWRVGRGTNREAQQFS